MTRIFETGFETNSVLPEMAATCGAVFSVAAVARFSGSAGLSAPANSGTSHLSCWRSISPVLTSFSIGFHFVTAGVSSGSPSIIQWLAASTVVGEVQIGTAMRPVLYVGTASVAAASLTLRLGQTASNWMHLGISACLAASGFIILWQDGVMSACYEGNTATVSPSVNEIRIARQSAANVLATGGAYYDNLFVDSGASMASPVADHRFFLLAASAAGASANQSPSPAASNFQNVDDWLTGSHDGDATYVAGSVTGRQDSYALHWLTPCAMKAGDTIAAVIPVAIARRQAASSASVYYTMALVSGCGGSTLGAAELIGASIDYRWMRSSYNTCNPNTGTAWGAATSAALTCLLMMQGFST